MGLLDTVLNEVAGGLGGPQGQKPSALQGMLTSLFSGVPGGQNATGVGGLQGLLSRFEAAGLGHIAQSWIDPNQENRQVSPDQLQQALGSEHVQAMAARTGMPPEQLLGQLAQFLPGLVSRLTPGGQVPPPHQDPTLTELGQEPGQGGGPEV
jgi:uncharacterized protein YidB (DUF937 family)